MKVNKLLLLGLIFGIGFMISSNAFAQSDKAIAQQNINGTVNVGVDLSVDDDDDNDVDDADKQEPAESRRQEKQDDDKDRNTTSESHRSTVAAFVQTLLSIGDREGGIGAEVKAIANAQNESQEETTEAIAKVENRSSFKTFFIGTDFKNLGRLRSQMVTTQNHIDQLKNMLSRMTSDTNKAELEAQIQVLEANQVKIDAFIKANESKFSLFGWMFK